MMTRQPVPYVKKEAGRTIVIGDIHGCFDELQRLLDLVKCEPGDLIVHVGDMIDRGPKSWEVAQFFRDTPNAISALGNHERRVAGAVAGTSVPAWSQLQTLSMIDQEIWHEWTGYFEALPAVVETPHAIVTHGRLDPALPIDQQDPYFTCAVGGAKVVIDRDDDGVPEWFHRLSNDKPICIGHIGYDRVELVPQMLYALDTGAVQGGVLTAVILPERRVVSVPVQRNYYAEARQQWQTQELSSNKWIAEWCLASSLPKGDFDVWPVRKVVAILLAKQPIANSVLAETFDRLNAAYSAMEIDQLVETIRRVLQDNYGQLPTEGTERGDYFRRLQSSSLRGKSGQLATKLLLRDEHGVAVLAHLMPKENLRNARDRLAALERALGGPAT